MEGTRELTVAIVGAAGLVGREIGNLLHERGFPLGPLRLLGSVRSAATEIEEDQWRGRVALLDAGAFEGIDVAFFAAGPGVAGEYADVATAAGAAVIDCSSRFRFDEDVPLVVPEVNATELSRRRERGIVAVPSATAIALSVVLAPLAQAVGLRRVIVSTYQGAASAGKRALDALSRETLDLMGGRGTERTRYAQSRAFNCVPQVGALLPGGDATHEAQAGLEARRVLGLEGLPMTITAVRVPTFFGTALSVVLETEGPLDADAATQILQAAPGVVVGGDGDAAFPTPIDITGSDATHVGRIRGDGASEQGLALWIALDSVRKGAALTAVQVGEFLARDYL